MVLLSDYTTKGIDQGEVDRVSCCFFLDQMVGMLLVLKGDSLTWLRPSNAAISPQSTVLIFLALHVRRSNTEPARVLGSYSTSTEK